jgi:hypothetical protein
MTILLLIMTIFWRKGKNIIGKKDCSTCFHKHFKKLKNSHNGVIKKVNDVSLDDDDQSSLNLTIFYLYLDHHHLSWLAQILPNNSQEQDYLDQMMNIRQTAGAKKHIWDSYSKLATSRQVRRTTVNLFRYTRTSITRVCNQWHAYITLSNWKINLWNYSLKQKYPC